MSISRCLNVMCVFYEGSIQNSQYHKLEFMVESRLCDMWVL